MEDFKKEINLNKKLIIVLILLSLITIGMYSSYALFNKKESFGEVVEMTTGDKLNLDTSGINLPVMFPESIAINNKNEVIEKMDKDNLNKSYQWHDYNKKELAKVVTVKEGEERFVSGEYKNILDTSHYTILEDGNLYLDGYDDFYTLGHANYDFGSNISIIVRFKLNNFNSSKNNFLIANNEGNMGFGVAIDGEQDFAVVVGNNWLSTGIKCDLNTWYTIVFTYNGENVDFYMNGLKVFSNSHTSNINISTIPLILGGNPGLAGIPNTAMSNITVTNALVYTDILSASEVSTYFNGEITNYPKDNILVDVGKGKYEEKQNYFSLTENNELYLNGENNFLTLGHDHEEFSNNQITMIARVKFHKKDLETSQEYFSNAEAAGGGLTFTKDNRIRFTYYIGDGYKDVLSDKTYDIEKWYTIVGVYDESYEYLYVDGELATDPIAVTGNIKTSPAPFMLGNNAKPYKLGEGVSNSTGFTNVTLSDVFVYKDAISSSEVTKYFKGEIKDYPKDNILINYRGFKEASDREIYLNSELGIKIKNEDVLATWEWIPRYSLIDNEIKYSWKIKNIDTRDSSFNYNGKELLGYWITKDNNININISNLDSSKFNLHDATTSEISATNKLKGTEETYSKTIAVYG